MRLLKYIVFALGFYGGANILLLILTYPIALQMAPPDVVVFDVFIGTVGLYLVPMSPMGIFFLAKKINALRHA